MRYLIFLLFPITLFGQVDESVNNQGVLTNEQALMLAQTEDYQTFNIPLQSVYTMPDESTINDLKKLKSGGYINVKLIDPVKEIYKVELTNSGKKYLTYSAVKNDVRLFYLACALVEPYEVLEVREHQYKKNAQIAVINYKVLRVSKLARGVLKEGMLLTREADFVPTSNGWRVDNIEKQSELKFLPSANSVYGRGEAKSYRTYLKDVAFVKTIPDIIEGKWEKRTSNAKKYEYYIFNEDGSFESFKGRKDETLTGKYKYKGEGTDKQSILLIPRDGKNKVIILSRPREVEDGGLIINSGLMGGVLFMKEGYETLPQGKTLVQKLLEEPAATTTEEDKKEVLEKRKTVLSGYLNGYWKQSNNKMTFDFKEENTLDYTERKSTTEGASYDLVIESNRLYFIVFDPDMNELLKEEVKKVSRDEITLGLRTFYKI